MLDIAGAPLTREELNDLEASPEGFALALPESVDERRLLDALYDDLERGEHAAAVLAEAEARRIAEYHRAAGPIPTVEGLGQLVLRVPLDVFLHWHAREGAEFWNQPENVEYIASRNPGLRPETARKPIVAMSDASPPAPRVRGRGRWAAA